MNEFAWPSVAVNMCQGISERARVSAEVYVAEKSQVFYFITPPLLYCCTATLFPVTASWQAAAVPSGAAAARPLLLVDRSSNDATMDAR